MQRFLSHHGLMILIYMSDLHLSIKLSFAFKHLKVLNQFFAPFQCETNKLCDLCWNISLSPTVLEKCPVQQPPPPRRGIWLAGASGCSSAWFLSGEQRRSLPEAVPDVRWDC